MNVFDNSEFEVQRDYYAKEAMEKWGDTEAYNESKEKTKNYSKEKWNDVNSEMNVIMSEFADCKNNGESPDSLRAQEIVKKWQDCITDNYYTCTKEILRGLGEMYIADERFTANIDKYGEGTARFMHEAIRAYCG